MYVDRNKYAYFTEGIGDSGTKNKQNENKSHVEISESSRGIVSGALDADGPCMGGDSGTPLGRLSLAGRFSRCQSFLVWLFFAVKIVQQGMTLQILHNWFLFTDLVMVIVYCSGVLLRVIFTRYTSMYVVPILIVLPTGLDWLVCFQKYDLGHIDSTQATA